MWYDPQARKIPWSMKWQPAHGNLLPYKCLENSTDSIYFDWRLITFQYCSGFCYTLTWISHACTRVPHTEPPFFPIPSLSQCTSVECPVSYIELGQVIYFTYGNIHFSMLFYQIIPPLPSPTEFKRLFFTCVSLLLSHIEGHCYRLSKFIYML